MFNWFWEFLYSISEILFEIIDGLMSIANMLCGIEPVTVDSQKTNFLSYLLNHDKIMYGFLGAAFVGIFLIMVFAIFAMIKSIKGKSDITPGQVAVKVIKTLGTFLFVPVVMVTFTLLVNELMIALYKATSMDASSMGDFLFKAFLPDGMDNAGFVDFRNVDSVDAFMEMKGYDLDDYRFFFSWICCIPLLFALAKGLLNFVDRTISIVLLFITSPLSISSSIVDDGAHFKLWREQVLVKFLTGYGIIIGLNVYILIVSIISSSSIVFFNSSFLDFLFKVAFILGGAVSLERVMALVGNLVSNGAGSNELRDSSLAYSGLQGYAKGIAGLAKRGIRKLPINGGGGGGGGGGAKKGPQNTATEPLNSGNKSSFGSNGASSMSQKSTQKQVLAALTGSKEDKKEGETDYKDIKANDADPAFLAGDMTTSGLNSTNKETKNDTFAALIGSIGKSEEK